MLCYVDEVSLGAHSFHLIWFHTLTFHHMDSFFIVIQTSSLSQSFHSYLVSSGILELLSKQLLAVREPVDSHQKLLLPLLAKIGFVTKVVEVFKNEAVLSIMKATTFFGTISLLKSAMHTTCLGEILTGLLSR